MSGAVRKCLNGQLTTLGTLLSESNRFQDSCLSSVSRHQSGALLQYHARFEGAVCYGLSDLSDLNQARLCWKSKHTFRACLDPCMSYFIIRINIHVTWIVDLYAPHSSHLPRTLLSIEMLRVSQHVCCSTVSSMRSTYVRAES